MTPSFGSPAPAPSSLKTVPSTFCVPGWLKRKGMLVMESSCTLLAFLVLISAV